MEEVSPDADKFHGDYYLVSDVDPILELFKDLVEFGECFAYTFSTCVIAGEEFQNQCAWCQSKSLLPKEESKKDE